MVEFYSSKEAGQIAHPCELGTLHVNSEACLVEVLDNDGVAVGTGERGRVVVTPIFETAQPLLRYEQGDWATLGATCPCGRHTPTLRTVDGRSIAIFTHPDGRSVAKLMPDNTSELLGAQYWQLAQVGPNEYELRYVPSVLGNGGDRTRVVEIFHATYFGDARLNIVPTLFIPPTAQGKLVEYVNEWLPVN